MPRITIDILPPHSTRLFFWKITESAEELSGLLPDGKELLDESCRCFKSGQRRREWLAARALLQSTPYSSCRIIYNSKGAPSLDREGKHISIRHTGELVAIAVSNAPVGLDIESRERNATKVTRLFFKEREIEQAGDDNNEALRLWTVKEAAFKLASENVSVLKDIETTFISEENGKYTYNIKYPDGKNAICRTYMTGGLFISVSSLT